MEETCTRCKHPRKSHSRRKCEEYIDDRAGKECPCKVKYMDKGKFR
jgi:hypothetical protein